MATTKILHDARVCDLATEHVHLELLEARDRIANLESDASTYQMLASVALETVAGLTARNRALADRIDELTQQLRDLISAPCQRCRGTSNTEAGAA